MAVELVFSCLGPIAVHLWLIIRIELSVRRQASLRQPNNAKRWAHVTRALRVMTIIHVVSIMPSALETSLSVVIVAAGSYSRAALRAVTVLWTLGEVGKVAISLENFLVYFLVSRAFRDTLRHLVCFGNPVNGLVCEKCSCLLFPKSDDTSGRHSSTVHHTSTDPS